MVNLKPNSMINLNNFTAVKNTLFSINFFGSLSNVDKKKNTCKFEPSSDSDSEESKPIKLTDHKTTLNGYSFNYIKEINKDIVVFIFIQKEKEYSSRHIVAPLIKECITRRTIQFNLCTFSLEGIGGGLGKTETLFHFLKLHFDKGFKVSVIPKVVNSQILNDFQYFDSGLKYQDLVDSSIDLVNYRKGSLEYVFRQYSKLIKTYELNQK